MLRAIYKIGSQCILPNHEDEDYLKIYDTEIEKKRALIKCHDHSVDWHFSSITKEKERPVFLGCYIRPFMELVEVEEIDEIKNFSIFNHIEEYKELLRHYAKSLSRSNKKWYHIYIAVKMLDKGTIELTKEEIATAQSIHDKGVNCEIYDYIIDYLK